MTFTLIKSKHSILHVVCNIFRLEILLRISIPWRVDHQKEKINYPEVF